MELFVFLYYVFVFYRCFENLLYLQTKVFSLEEIKAMTKTIVEIKTIRLYNRYFQV